MTFVYNWDSWVLNSLPRSFMSCGSGGTLTEDLGQSKQYDPAQSCTNIIEVPILRSLKDLHPAGLLVKHGFGLEYKDD